MPTEYMTYDQIKATFPDSWLLIVDFDIDPRTTDIKGGRVAIACPDRDELHRRMADYPNQRLAIRCTKPWPKDFAWISPKWAM